MIIDLILDRKDNEKYGIYNYNASDFYRDIMSYESIFDFDRTISYAMDYGTNKDIQKALCDYIKNNGYNTKICDYVNNKNWVEND